MSRPACILIGCFALVLTLVSGHPASAHGLGAECRLRGEHVEVEAYYHDDTPVGNGTVRVFDEQRNPVAEGRTDAEGKWTFPAPQAGRYRVVVDAGAGHRATVRLTVPAVHEVSDRSNSPLVSEGPSRQEFTAAPWLKLVLGFGAIAGFGLFLWVTKSKPAAYSASK